MAIASSPSSSSTAAIAAGSASERTVRLYPISPGRRPESSGTSISTRVPPPGRSLSRTAPACPSTSSTVAGSSVGGTLPRADSCASSRRDAPPDARAIETAPRRRRSRSSVSSSAGAYCGWYPGAPGGRPSSSETCASTRGTPSDIPTRRRGRPSAPQVPSASSSSGFASSALRPSRISTVGTYPFSPGAWPAESGHSSPYISASSSCDSGADSFDAPTAPRLGAADGRTPSGAGARPSASSAGMPSWSRSALETRAVGT